MMDGQLKKINTAEFSTSELETAVWEILETVSDPEVPVLSVVDLGIIRKVAVIAEAPEVLVSLFITPTYSGCPAIDMMNIQIRMALLEAGFKNIRIDQILSPAWTTDWMSKKGKEKLKAYGIAPPHLQKTNASQDSFQDDEVIACPLCNSVHTRLVSQFGSTACKALYQCNDCKEPFDYFKCH